MMPKTMGVEELQESTPPGPIIGPVEHVCRLTARFCASLKHKYDGQTKFIKPNSQRQDRIIKYWVSIGSIHREQG